MKSRPLIVATLLLAGGFLCSGCHTAHYAAAGAVDESAHAVQKTSHAVAHGARKVERHL